MRKPPKGITPAYLNPDGSPGESFLVLKMRAALVQAARWRERFGTPDRPVLPFFQMTSAGTDGSGLVALVELANQPQAETLPTDVIAAHPV